MTGRSRSVRGLRHAALACCGAGVVIGAACYDTGDGTSPPPNQFYFPVGLAVSGGGNVLYAVNSDFDLQYNGGTVQSYDLNQLRNDTVRLMVGAYTGGPNLGDAGLGAGVDAALPWSGAPFDGGCPDPSQTNPPLDPSAPSAFQGNPARVPIGQACSPPIDSTPYFRDSVTIGAFATTVVFGKYDGRLFIPVRGDGSLTWIDVVNDATWSDPNAGGAVGQPPTPGEPASKYLPFQLQCEADKDPERRCSSRHNAGRNGANGDIGNTRQVQMPGEPFGIALSDDYTAAAVTHQTDTETSLFLTGLDVPAAGDIGPPSIQFLVGGMPTGGIGLAAVPHDLQALTPDPSGPSPVPLRPAFLQTSASTPEVDLLRYYLDEGYQGLVPAPPDGGTNPVVDLEAGIVVNSSNERPFLVKERAYSVNVNASGAQSRGIAIDDTPRRACKAALLAQGVPSTDPQWVACAQLPARVFIANRSPPSLILGKIGGFVEGSATYDPDLFVLSGNVPLANGPSNVYLAPIVDASGHYALRVFIVCFDSQVIVVWDPDAQRIENVIRTGPGPFAMAFDPFDLDAVARRDLVLFDPRAVVSIQSAGDPADGKPALRNYRFAYIASFTDSFVQVMDLDQSFHDDRVQGGSTFETIVYSFGRPTLPKGAQ